MESFEHFLITRFNVASEFAPGAGLQPEWLERRLPLFLEFCLPSVAGQSRRDFRWIVMVDGRTPAPYLRRIAGALEAEGGRFGTLEVGEDWLGDLRRHLRERVAPGTGHLITTRMDNDDCIHRDFIAGVQRGLAGRDLALFDFRSGFTYALPTRTLRTHEPAMNPFLSLKERNADPCRTVYCDQYDHLHRELPLVRADQPAAWVQVIHGQNVSNREKGRKFCGEPGLLRRDFGVNHEPAA